MSERAVISTVDQLEASVGGTIGVGEWFELTQDRVDAFADVTGDDQWIHVDVKRARATPYGGTIAHGFLLLSLTPLTRGYEIRIGSRMLLNYGLNRVRFPASAPVGRRVRLHTRVLSLDRPNPGELQLVLEHALEVEGQQKPVMVAEHVTRYYLDDG